MVCGIVLRATSLPSTDSTPVPPLPKPGPSYLKSNTTVCLPGVSAAWPFPAEAFESKKLHIGKDRLALEQVEAMSAETATDRIDHPFGTSLRNVDLGRDGARLAESVGGVPWGMPDTSPE